MTASSRHDGSQPGAIIDRWRAFWFRAEPAYTLGLVRLAFGALVVGWALSLLPDLYELFGSNGVAPRQPSQPYLWGIFGVWTSDNALIIGWVVLFVSAVAVTVGWHSRLAAILVFVMVMSFERRAMFVFNSGDDVVRIEALFLALCSCGAALSLDQRHRTG
jgi:hypothetical protein